MADKRVLRQWGRASHARSGRRHVVAVVMAIVGVVTGGVWLWYLGERSRVTTDPDTLCRSGKPPSEVIVLLLDLSEEFSEAQRLKVTNDLAGIQREVRQFGLIDVYAIGRNSKTVIRPILQLCNPGDGADMNRVYQNPERARRRWDDFSKRLTQEVARLMSDAGTSSSPIMEAIQATALRTFNSPAFDGLRKRLFIVSDLLQYVPGRMNHYESITPFEDLKTMPYFVEVRSNLTGVEVTLLYLVRAAAPQPWPKHRVFWEHFFQAQGATVERIEPVFGDKRGRL